MSLRRKKEPSILGHLLKERGIKDKAGIHELVKEHKSDISGIEDKIIFLYSQGVSTCYIQKTMR